MAEIVRPGTGLTPAPIIASMPDRVIRATLKSPNQLSWSRVRGRAKRRVAAAKMRAKNMLHRPLLDNEDRACCPDNSCEPYIQVLVIAGEI